MQSAWAYLVAVVIVLSGIFIWWNDSGNSSEDLDLRPLPAESNSTSTTTSLQNELPGTSTTTMENASSSQ